MKTRFVTRYYKWYQHRVIEWFCLVAGIAMTTYCILQVLDIVKWMIR